jgi:hypothetical protein
LTVTEHPLVTHAWWIATERERMGFVWAGDMEKDPRRAGGGRVAWGRKPNNDLYVLDPEADPDWSPTSDERWDECYPYAGQPPRLPDDYDRSHR